jgi:hypothetical protein
MEKTTGELDMVLSCSGQQNSNEPSDIFALEDMFEIDILLSL